MEKCGSMDIDFLTTSQSSPLILSTCCTWTTSDLKHELFLQQQTWECWSVASLVMANNGSAHVILYWLPLPSMNHDFYWRRLSLLSDVSITDIVWPENLLHSPQASLDKGQNVLRSVIYIPSRHQSQTTISSTLGIINFPHGE